MMNKACQDFLIGLTAKVNYSSADIVTEIGIKSGIYDDSTRTVGLVSSPNDEGTGHAAAWFGNDIRIWELPHATFYRGFYERESELEQAQAFLHEMIHLTMEQSDVAIAASLGWKEPSGGVNANDYWNQELSNNCNVFGKKKQ